MRTHNPLLKLLKGVILLTIYLIDIEYLGGVEGLDDVVKMLTRDLNFLPYGLASILADIVGIILSLGIVYAAVSGFYRICTFPHYLETWER